MLTTKEALSHRPLPQLLTLPETCDETRYLLRIKDHIRHLCFQTDLPEIRAMLETLDAAVDARQKEVLDQMELLYCGSSTPAISPCTATEYRIDSRIIAEKLGIEHRALLQTIVKYQPELTHFGAVAFEMQPLPNGGIPTRYALLNENQSIFLATLSRNTQKVVRFKMWLTAEFSKHRIDVKPVSHPEVTPMPEPVPMPPDYFTVSGWIGWHGYRVSLPTAQDIGKQCTRWSLERGYKVHKVRNDLYGHINAYHYSILRAVTGLPTN